MLIDALAAVTKQKRITIALAVMAFLLALGLTLYPVISNYVNQKYASQIHTAYQEVMEQADDSDLLKAKELADAYNHTLVPGATAAYSQEGLQAASADYDSQLDVAGNGIMGYVEIPKIRVNLPIYHGTENDSLERGIGHLLGSSLPVGGESTHSILSGHSGIDADNIRAAKPRLERIETDILNNFKRLGVSAEVLNGQDSLFLLYSITRWHHLHLYNRWELFLRIS